MRALLLAAVLFVTLLAVAPGAEAKPDPPQCVHGGLVFGVGPVTVRTNCGSAPTVSVDPECLRVEGC